MTRLLDQAIAKLRELSETEQDEVAEVLLTVAAKGRGPVRLDEESRAGVRRGLAEARRGEFVGDELAEAFFKRHRG